MDRRQHAPRARALRADQQVLPVANPGRASSSIRRSRAASRRICVACAFSSMRATLRVPGIGTTS
ncbi:MAG: hypothetical protein ACK6DH_05400, partial [Planctomycetota bacterium]